MRWWLSFWSSDISKFEYHGPWWISGYDSNNRRSVCAAVIADNESEAKETIKNAHDSGFEPDEWRFINNRSDEWSPFSDRFQKREWMKWP